ncbi:sporulation protein [Actinokineospora bangkokensis]|uniref:SpoOM family protein n=1 Tax=Actinokineospora bangkokensis TaxID=1193682 RepID=A0A1Q9LH00_9PSEU|nr:sporulation protein [Actinokineospora bangkokensis]OLR91284.1 SpoOM family protein [Actinokineospora bangkokensis]
MFKRMLSAFGVGGPSVDTVLHSPHARPGQVIGGEVRIQGGSAPADVDRVLLSLVTRVEVEHGDHEGVATGELLRVAVADRVHVREGQRLDLPFRLEVPWEAPITAVGGAPLPGAGVGLRTELVVAGAPDPGDLDPVQVHPLPSQERVLDAFGELGFQFRTADVEAGVLHGVPQVMGFFQELEFFPPHHLAGRVQQVELTFVATPHELHVVLEADKRGGLFRAGGDVFGRFAMPHHEAERADWRPIIDGWLNQVAHGHGGHHGGGHYGGQHYGDHQYGGHGLHGGHHGHDQHRGPGMGAMIGGAAAGIFGGMVLGEVVEEIFDED